VLHLGGGGGETKVGKLDEKKKIHIERNVYDVLNVSVAFSKFIDYLFMFDFFKEQYEFY
jgi:hypothetical protein